MKRQKNLHVDFIELHIMHHAAEAPLYGLWMIEELARHGYRLSASHLYPRFHRLERDALVRREDKVVDGKLRKYYRLTAQGRSYLKKQKLRLMELVGEAFTTDELRALLEKRAAREARKHATVPAADGSASMDPGVARHSRTSRLIARNAT
jgi:DNA-binding PadR family transcriptional regulator